MFGQLKTIGVAGLYLLAFYSPQTRELGVGCRVRGDELPMSVTVADLDEAKSEFKSTFVHEFRNGMPRDYFANTLTKPGTVVTDDGLRMIQDTNGGPNILQICMQLHGDFDLEASFSHLKCSAPGNGGFAGIQLGCFIESSTYDYVAMVRRDHTAIPERKITLSHGWRKSGGGRSYTEYHSDEAIESGKFRLSRRGNFVYGLYSPGDAPDYRLLQKVTVPNGRVGVQGLRLLLESPPEPGVEVTWNSLKIFAEKITGDPIRRSVKIADALKSAREKKSELIVDTADPDSVDSLLRLDRVARSVREHTDEGMRVTLVSNNGDRSAHMAADVGSLAGFDIEAELELHQLESPDPGSVCSELGVQVFLKHDAPNGPAVPDEVALLLRRDADGKLILTARYVAMDGTRKIYRLIRTTEVNELQRVRIAQHDGRIVFLYRDAQSDQDVAFADYLLTSECTASSVDLYSAAKGTAFVTDVTWKSLRVFSIAGE